MIFVVYSRPEPGREGGNVTKEFKLVLESAFDQLMNLHPTMHIQSYMG